MNEKKLSKRLTRRLWNIDDKTSFLTEAEHAEIIELEDRIEVDTKLIARLESCDLCDDLAEYRQCQKCMNDKFIGSHTDEEYEALQRQKDALFRGISSVRNVIKEVLEGGPLFKLDALWLWRVVNGTYKAGGGKDDQLAHQTSTPHLGLDHGD